MDMKRMISFQKVANYKSFSRAAKELFISQSTITVHISELEKEFGVKLLVRNKKKVELTSCGELFLDYTKQTINSFKNINASLSSIKNGMQGRLSLAFSGAVCYWFIPKVRRFIELFPLIDLQLHTSLSSEIIDMLLNRKIDLGIIRDLNLNYSHPLLKSILIESDNIIPVISTKHKLAKLEEVTFNNILNERIILYGKSPGINQWFLEGFYNAGVKPKVMLEVTDFQTAKLFVQELMGVTFIAEITVKDEIENGKLKKLPLKGRESLPIHSILIYHKELSMTGYINEFIKMMT